MKATGDVDDDDGGDLGNGSVPGEPRPARELLPLVYVELRRLAAQRLAREAPGRPCRPRRSCTKRICDWSAAILTGHGMAAVISSQQQPRRCGESWSRTPVAGTD